MRIRTLRGTVVPDTTKRLIVNDGRLNHGFRIVRFVCSGDPRDATDDSFATLGLDADVPGTWDWGDNRQIAWASTHQRATNSVDAPFELVDKNSIVLMDLFIRGSSNSPYINYYIELEPVVLTQDESIMVLIKERSQDDLN